MLLLGRTREAAAQLAALFKTTSISRSSRSLQPGRHAHDSEIEPSGSNFGSDADSGSGYGSSSFAFGVGLPADSLAFKRAQPRAQAQRQSQDQPLPQERSAADRDTDAEGNGPARRKGVEKLYWAVVAGSPEREAGRITAPLTRLREVCAFVHFLFFFLSLFPRPLPRVL